MVRGKKKTTMAEKDEVDQLLEAAQDEFMLNLSLDSHISSDSSDYIDPDLRRRFDALRSRRTASNHPPVEKRMPRSEDLGETHDDLMARFAALKASSLPASSSSSSSVSAVPQDGDGGEEDDEDEVEKVIKWAIDAARLDPSPDSEDDLAHCSNDDDGDGNDDDGDGDDDDDDDKVGSKKDGKK